MRRFRRSLITLVALGAFTLSLQAPLQAATRPAAARGLAAQAGGLSLTFAQVWQPLWQRLEALRFKGGSSLDPSGQGHKSGSVIDPNGKDVDEGSGIDPHG